MPPQSFEYVAPTGTADALATLAEHRDAAKVLAGGQSLVPMMNLRLARPDVIVDINRLADLSHLSVSHGELHIGALVRHRDLERPVVADPVGTLLAQTAHHVAHLPVRVRGTFVGSLAHADPAAEWCLVAVTVGARLVLNATTGERIVDADDFFDYPFVTALRADELVTEARLPLLGPGTGVAFRELAATAGGFAQAAACAAVRIEAGRIVVARIAVGAVMGRPTGLPEVEEVLVGAEPSETVFAEVRRRARAAVHPVDDPRVPADYRRALAAELVVAAGRDAARDAGARWS
jgi:carbon-monoxide dehydrogenase medium subunit